MDSHQTYDQSKETPYKRVHVKALEADNGKLRSHRCKPDKRCYVETYGAQDKGRSWSPETAVGVS